MTQAKKKASWNLITMVCVGLVGVGSTQIKDIFVRGESAGAITARIKHVTDECHRIKVDGCDPSKKVIAQLSKMVEVDANLRNDLVRVEAANREDHLRIEAKLDRILERVIISSDIKGK